MEVGGFGQIQLINRSINSFCGHASKAFWGELSCRPSPFLSLSEFRTQDTLLDIYIWYVKVSFCFFYHRNYLFFVIYYSRSQMCRHLWYINFLCNIRIFRIKYWQIAFFCIIVFHFFYVMERIHMKLRYGKKWYTSLNRSRNVNAKVIVFFWAKYIFFYFVLGYKLYL